MRHAPATERPTPWVEIEILEEEGGPEVRSHAWNRRAAHDPELAFLEPDSLPLPIADAVRRVADETGARVDRAVFRWTRRLAGLARVGDIRRQSRLRLHAWAPLPEVLDRLGDAPLDVHDRGRRVLWSETPFTPWRRGAYRTAATLSIRWSWPDIPVWVVVEPWWRDHSVVTISLRSTRRIRYPRRYWDASHRAVRALILDAR